MKKIKDYPNLVLIAGDKRKVGKTFLACKIIKHLSAFTEVIGIKISPHFHEQEENRAIIAQNDNYTIIEEKSITHKDSALMLQSGAKRVFFIMVKQQHIKEAFCAIENELKNLPVVCESGGLNEIINPGLFLFVKNKNTDIQKEQYLKYAPMIVSNALPEINFDEKCIGFNNNRITINHEP